MAVGGSKIHERPAHFFIDIYRKELTYEEQLQYQIELLKRELLKKEAEVIRLKKLNERKGGGAQRR